MVDEFARACGLGDLDALVAVLHRDVTGEFDSGGVIPGAPVEAVSGRDAVARLLHGAFATTGATFAVEPVNGEPGVVVSWDDRIAAVIAFVVSDGKVLRIHGVGNPAKLPGRR